jgi:hypothetical protein
MGALLNMLAHEFSHSPASVRYPITDILTAQKDAFHVRSA